MGARTKKPLPAGIPATDQESEKHLLDRLSENLADAEYLETLWQLARFYISVSNHNLASALIYDMLEVDDSADHKAFCYLALGQIAETRSQYNAAIDFYTTGLTFRTQDKSVKYLLHNNTGYCLNVQGMHKEAETYCRLAIEIDSSKANALKNLGISLAGQNDLIGAAWAWFEAIRADATDPRASQLLQILLEDHPEVVAQLYGVLKQLEDCKKAGLQ